MWTAGWPPEEDQRTLELISDLIWSADGVTDQRGPVPCGRGLGPMAPGGTTTEATTRRCLGSGARGREGLRSLSICCHRTFYGVVGWFLFVLNNQGTESEELVLSIRCSWHLRDGG